MSEQYTEPGWYVLDVDMPNRKKHECFWYTDEDLSRHHELYEAYRWKLYPVPSMTAEIGEPK